MSPADKIFSNLYLVAHNRMSFTLFLCLLFVFAVIQASALSPRQRLRQKAGYPVYQQQCQSNHKDKTSKPLGALDTWFHNNIQILLGANVGASRAILYEATSSVTLKELSISVDWKGLFEYSVIGKAFAVSAALYIRRDGTPVQALNPFLNNGAYLTTSTQDLSSAAPLYPETAGVIYGQLMVLLDPNDASEQRFEYSSIKDAEELKEFNLNTGDQIVLGYRVGALHADGTPQPGIPAGGHVVAFGSFNYAYKHA